jgi:hypothetical protein
VTNDQPPKPDCPTSDWLAQGSDVCRRMWAFVMVENLRLMLAQRHREAQAHRLMGSDGEAVGTGETVTGIEVRPFDQIGVRDETS